MLAVVCVAPVFAVDGVIEINQARAKAGGVTAGDTPLFPVTIDRAGSYRLTGNLDLTDASARQPATAAKDVTAINVTAGNVTIDLNGFSIIGETSCPGFPPVCSGTGSGAGIDTSDSAIGVAITNGVVQGMGQVGIRLRNGAGRIERVRVSDNGVDGLSCLECVVHGNTSTNNGRRGIVASNATVRDNVSVNNAEDGFDCSGAVTGNFSRFNVTGFQLGNGTFIGNESTDNSGIGVDLFSTATLVNNRIHQNGGAGIDAGGSATILGNVITSNTGLGILSTSSSRVGYGTNVVNDNNGGNANPQVSAGMNQIGTNVCGADTVCP
jgi:hypothetical protein